MKEFFWILALTASWVVAQAQGFKDEHDGIFLEPVSINVPTVYYGQHYVIYFKLGSNRNTPSPYSKAATHVNIRFKLKNLATGQLMPCMNEIYGNDATWAIETQMRKGTFAKYQPMEQYFYPLDMNNWFGSVRLTNEDLGRGSNGMKEKLHAIPVGEYELTFEYDLLPDSRVLKAMYRFKVLPVPAAEKQAFNRFVESTLYSFRTHMFTYGGSNYSPASPRSYDNFIKNFPNSIYTNDAYLNVVNENYGLYQGGVPMNERLAKFEEYLTYFPHLKNDMEKANYVRSLPSFFGALKKDEKKEIDAFLLKIRNENPLISEFLISRSRVDYGITNLTNYAAERAKDNR